jgi:hypothetical protein
MTKVRLNVNAEISGVEYEAGDVLDLGTNTAEKLVEAGSAHFEDSLDKVEVEIKEDSFVENYSADQPLDNQNDD